MARPVARDVSPLADAGRHLGRDPVMRRVIARHGPCGLVPRKLSPYESLVRAMEQQMEGLHLEKPSAALAVALTPPDMLSPFLLAIPLLALYGLSIGVAYLFRNRQPAAGEMATEAPPL